MLTEGDLMSASFNNIRVMMNAFFEELTGLIDIAGSH